MLPVQEADSRDRVAPNVTEKENRDSAREVLERHIAGKSKRRARDLTAEKYLLHVDGTNDGQWAEIVNGSSIFVPPKMSTGIRSQRNLLRPMTENMVAYHTAIPLRVVAEHPPGRRARELGQVDSAVANHWLAHQRGNAKAAEAMFVAGVYGHCPIHATWRTDYTKNPYQTEAGIRWPGYVEWWVGDPWDTVYDDAATRNRVYRISYGKIFPLKIVRQAFGDVPGVMELKGTEDLPSASRFQQIMRQWQWLNQHHHASAVINRGYKNEELIGLVCEEEFPDSENPEGKLRIVALNASATTDRYRATSRTDNALMLHEGPLPAGRSSVTRFYSTNRFDDVLGKPYVEDLDSLQIELNQVATLSLERLRRFSRPQLTAKAQSLEDDTVINDPDYVLYYTHDKPDFLSPPMGNPDMERSVAEIEAQMFRIGGWQAASRGEGMSGDAAAKVVALAKADDTIFGPVRRSFEDSIIELLQLSHKLTKDFAELPFIAQVAGEDLSYAVDPWVNADDMSDDPPNFRVVSGFGATPESLAQNLLTLVGMTDSQGAPLLTEAEFWERHPDPSLKPRRPSATTIKRKRLLARNNFIEKICKAAEQEFQDAIGQQPQLAFRLAESIYQQVRGHFMPLRTDNIGQAIETLDELAHDTEVSKLTSSVAQLAQNEYFEWMAAMQASAPGPAGPQAVQGPPGGRPQGQRQGTPPGVSQQGGTGRSEDIARSSGEVRKLTAEAKAQ